MVQGLLKNLLLRDRISSSRVLWNYCGVLGKHLLPLGLLEPQHVAPLATVYLHGPGNGCQVLDVLNDIGSNRVRSVFSIFDRDSDVPHFLPAIRAGVLAFLRRRGKCCSNVLCFVL